MSVFLARYLNGETSQPQTVEVSFLSDGLSLSFEDGSQKRVSFSALFVKEDWCDGIGVTLGERGNPLTSLVIAHKGAFRAVERRLGRKSRATFLLPNRWGFLGGLAISSVLLLFGSLFAVHHLLTGAVRLIPLSMERKIGDLVLKDMNTEFKECKDDETKSALRRILARLVAATGQKGLNPQVTLYRDGMTNAFTLPGEHMAVMSGLLRDARSEDEIAGVLAHELGHMIKRDPMQSVLEAGGIKVLTGGGSGIAEAAGFLQMLSYSRDKEYAADDFAVRLLLKAGYSEEGLASFLTRVDKEENRTILASVPREAEWISTHPDTKERIKRIRTLGGTFEKHRISPALSTSSFLRVKQGCSTGSVAR